MELVPHMEVNTMNHDLRLTFWSRVCAYLLFNSLHILYIYIQWNQNACRCVCKLIQTLNTSINTTTFWQTQPWCDFTEWGRCLPNEEGGCCRWGRRVRGGGSSDRCWEPGLAGAPQSAGRLGAAVAAAAGGGGGGHGGDWDLWGYEIPVCIPH